MRLYFKKFIALVILTCLISSVFEPIVAYAKNTPDWWPYWEVAGYKEKCDKGETGKWNSKYCECWMPLGWAAEPAKYSSDDAKKPSQRQWRNFMWEGYWKWYSRIRMNYNAMIKTEEGEAVDTSTQDKIMKQSDELLRAANALCVASNFDGAFVNYFPDYTSFMSASVEDLRLLKQWIDLETAWIKSISLAGQNNSDVEQEELKKLNQLLWEHKRAIATADDVLKEIIGFGLGGATQWLLDALTTVLDGFKKIDEIIGQIKDMLKPILEPIEKLVETMTNVVDKIADSLEGIKDTIKDIFGGMVSWIPGAKDKVEEYIDENLDLKKIVEEFKKSFNIKEITDNLVNAFKNLKDIKIGDKSIEDWKKLIDEITKKFQVAKEWLEELIPLKAYNYGQTQVLQAAGSFAAHMAQTVNRTDRELAGFMETKLTAEHTKIARKTAVRKNMVIAGQKAMAAKGGKKIKLGFN